MLSKGSMLVSWPAVFSDTDMATALLDRLPPSLRVRRNWQESWRCKTGLKANMDEAVTDTWFVFCNPTSAGRSRSDRHHGGAFRAD
jgi:hypothetical protein